MSDQNTRALLSMKQQLTHQEQERQEKLLVELRGGINQKFIFTKGKVHKEAYLVEIKTREVRLKRELSAQDSFSVGIKDFTKFWKLA